MPAIDDLTTSDDLNAEYLNRRIDDWETRLLALYEDVESWLPASWMVKSRPTVSMHEELMKINNVPARQIHALHLQNALGKQASLDPKGLWIIGANGRVDLRTPSGQYVIVDVAEDFMPPLWKVSSMKDRSHLEALGKSFLQAALS